MAHDVEDPNTASSQFFFLQENPTLMEAPQSTFNGRYSCFGYVTQNQDFVKQIGKGDNIVTMKVVRGSENLVLGKKPQPPQG